MLKLPRNIVFENGYFYDGKGVIDKGTEVTGYLLKARNEEEKHDYESTFMVPTNLTNLANCEILMEHFPDLMNKKMSYTHLFNTIPNEKNALVLSNFMNSVYKAMLDALLFADKLYWLDRDAKVRTDKTLDYCLAQGLRVAEVELKTEKVISDINLPEVLVKQNLEDDFDAQITNRNKTIGVDVANAAAKNKPKKKSRKGTKNK